MLTTKQVLEHDWPLSLDPEFETYCPCAHIKGENFEIDIHCWRGGCDKCQYSGIHVSGTLDAETKRKLAEHIRDNNGWSNHTDWNIVIQ